MLLSVITPSHDTRYLHEVYRSLTLQTYPYWEWVVLLNGAAKELDPAILANPRVRLFRSSAAKIGTLKAAAATYALGDIIVELDHDDWLMPTALEWIVYAYREEPDASMIWSDFAHMDENGEPSSHSYANELWEYTSEFAYNKRWHRVCGKETTFQNVSRIWTAPNHLRAWPIKKYWEVGGHEDLDILDDQALMQRLYTAGSFVHIREMLYLQRLHGQNTQLDPETNARIQELTVKMGDEWLATL